MTEYLLVMTILIGLNLVGIFLIMKKYKVLNMKIDRLEKYNQNLVGINYLSSLKNKDNLLNLYQDVIGLDKNLAGFEDQISLLSLDKNKGALLDLLTSDQVSAKLRFKDDQVEAKWLLHLDASCKGKYNDTWKVSKALSKEVDDFDPGVEKLIDHIIDVRLYLNKQLLLMSQLLEDLT